MKRGGRRPYWTCAVFKAEGQEQIDGFLQRHGDAAPLAEPRAPGHLLPLPDNGDGFFYGLLHKT